MSHSHFGYMVCRLTGAYVTGYVRKADVLDNIRSGRIEDTLSMIQRPILFFSEDDKVSVTLPPDLHAEAIVVKPTIPQPSILATNDV